MVNNETTRVSDKELFLLIAQGNAEARKILDERYFFYCKNIVTDFLKAHCNYGYSYDDFFNAAMLGYCKARMRFNYEHSDGFFPYFRIWAFSEMKILCEEGKTFFLNENPSKFISLDLTYNKDEDEMIIAESIGADDSGILSDIRLNEIVTAITDSSSGLNDIEAVICSCLVMKYSEAEIRYFLNINYRKYREYIASIKSKLSGKLKDIVK